MKNTSISIGKMVRLAVLVAIILIMAYTPLGYLKIGTIEITFLMIPVAVAGIIVGPAAGALAGAVFGLTSFLQCFGQSLFGSMLLNIDPIFTFIICMGPRIAAGWLPGLIYRGIYGLSGVSLQNAPTGQPSLILRRTLSAAVACLSASVLNTILFVGTLFVLFGRTEYIRQFGDNIWAITVVLVGVNALVEIAVCTIAGTAVSSALIHLAPVDKRSAPRAKI